MKTWIDVLAEIDSVAKTYHVAFVDLQKSYINKMKQWKLIYSDENLLFPEFEQESFREFKRFNIDNQPINRQQANVDLLETLKGKARLYWGRKYWTFGKILSFQNFNLKSTHAVKTLPANVESDLQDWLRLDGQSFHDTLAAKAADPNDPQSALLKKFESFRPDDFKDFALYTLVRHQIRRIVNDYIQPFTQVEFQKLQKAIQNENLPFADKDIEYWRQLLIDNIDPSVNGWSSQNKNIILHSSFENFREVLISNIVTKYIKFWILSGSQKLSPIILDINMPEDKLTDIEKTVLESADILSLQNDDPAVLSAKLEELFTDLENAVNYERNKHSQIKASIASSLHTINRILMHEMPKNRSSKSTFAEKLTNIFLDW